MFPNDVLLFLLPQQFLQFFFLILFLYDLLPKRSRKSDEVACRTDIGGEVEAGQSVDVAVGKDEERGWGRERWPPLRLEIEDRVVIGGVTQREGLLVRDLIRSFRPLGTPFYQNFFGFEASWCVNISTSTSFKRDYNSNTKTIFK